MVRDMPAPAPVAEDAPSLKGAIEDNDVLYLPRIPPDPFESVIAEMLELYHRKRKDYAGNGDAFSNFRRSADQVQAAPILSTEVLIATKQARLRELMWTLDREPVNESIDDTLIDRAVYSVIAIVLWREARAR